MKLALALIIFLMLLHPAGARDEEGMRVVPAQEILDKIERGEPVEYDHVIVEGDLNLRELDIPRTQIKRTYFELRWLGLDENTSEVSSSIRINDSTINGNISFANAIFGNSVGFSRSYFNSTADFRGSDFNSTADFGGSDFKSDAYFWDSDFNGDANFAGSHFNGDANFERSHFNKTADFWYSDFNGDANFGVSAFNGTADFMYSDFYSTADFGGSDFNGDAHFIYSDFNGTAHFNNLIINGGASFEDSAFKSRVNFINSVFNSDAYFRRTTFNISEFFSAEFNKPVYFNDANFRNFTSFKSGRFKDDALFEGALFDGTLYLTRAKYDRLYIRWKNIKELGYDDAAYLTLLENFKRLGYAEDYDACYYEYRRLHRDQPWSGKYHGMHPMEEWLRKRIDLGLQAFYGYGKKPLWPLLWSAGTILLFGLIWRRAGVDRSKSRGSIFERFGPDGEEKQKQSQKEQLRALGGAMLFSATLFLSGTRLFVDPPAMPKLEGMLAAHARSFFIAERVLGAFFSILFFLAISGTVVR